MAIAAYRVLLPPIRLAARAMLYNVLRLSRRLVGNRPVPGRRLLGLILSFRCGTGGSMRSFGVIAHAIRARQRVSGGFVPVQLPSRFSDLSGPDREFLNFVRSTLKPAVYRRAYPDVAAAGTDPVEHWLTNGLYEGRMLARRLAVRRGPAASRPCATDLRRFSWRDEVIVISGRLPRQRLADVSPAGIVPENAGFTLSGEPVVSVIIPTYGQTAFTMRCLASIQLHLPEVPIEIIVVDDAFPGAETAPLAAVMGVRLLRNETNLGFIRACNAAARMARGQFIMFLNNDTEVLPGWLDRMLDIFASRPDAGIVGSKLIGDDGALQEAGGIIWRDASGWNFGRGRDPDEAEFNYVREVDYCSGASLLVRREVFLEVGGFDERYAPAYCEDSDLSFRLRRHGLKTFYQPRSEIIHFEGVSHGRDVGRGVKSYQVANQAAFRDRWRAELTRDHYLPGTRVFRAKERTRDRQVVLIVDHGVPEPDGDAGSRTMIAFIRTFLSAGAVVKFWPSNPRATPGYTEALQDMGVEVFYAPDQMALPVWLKANGGELDLVLISRPDVAETYLGMIRPATKARIAYYGHDLHHRRMMAHADQTGDETERRDAEIMRAREMTVWREADLVLYPSEEEAAVVRELVPSAVVRAVVPYALDDAPHSDVAREPWILFVGGFAHSPNADAAIWFVREVLPSIVARVPEARFAIVGSNPTRAVSAL